MDFFHSALEDYEALMMRQLAEKMEGFSPAFIPDTVLENWEFDDTLDALDRFPYLSKDEAKIETTRATLAMILDKYLKEGVAPPLVFAVCVALKWFISTGLNTEDPAVRVKVDEHPSLDLNEIHSLQMPLLRWVLFLTHLTKIQWFKSGHHLGPIRECSVVHRLAYMFDVPDTGYNYNMTWRLIWHISHLLDTRTALAHLGIMDMFPGCKNYKTGDDDLLKSLFVDVFPQGSTILVQANLVFRDLSQCKLAKYYKDCGTAQRLVTAFKQVKADPASFHPQAHILGKKRLYHEFTKEDERVVSAIAHVMYDQGQLHRLRDTILPLDDIFDMQFYQSLKAVKQKIKTRKEYELTPCKTPFTYTYLT